MAVSTIELALAVSAQPVSVDTLVTWGLTRPSELIAWLDGARAREEITEEAGHLRLNEETSQGVLVDATEEDFRVLAQIPALVPDLLTTPRRVATARGTRTATALCRAVFDTVPPEDFPGGPKGFVAAVVEVVSLYRLWGLMDETLQVAIDLATEHGDLASQAPLLAARALGVVIGHFPGDSQALLERAHEAAEAVGGAVRIGVLVNTAINFVFVGKLREAIAAFEALLGDVPADLLTAESHPLLDADPDSATPAAALVILAVAYSDGGQHPRSIELLHQLRTLGERLQRPRLIEEAELFLGLLHVRRGEYEAAVPYVEASFERFRSGEDEPAYGWFAGLELTLLRCWQGRLGEARTAFDFAAGAWLRAGMPPLGREPYDIFEYFEAAGEELHTPLDILAEAERGVHMPLVHTAGMARHFLACRKLRTAQTNDDLAAVADEFDTAMALLREAGAAYDLARVCTDAATLAERRDRSAEAQRHRSEVAALLPSRPQSTPVHQAARLRSVVLGLGRLPLAGHGEGFWGELCARLCKGVGAERCAVVELDPPRLLAARGGTSAWQEEILDVRHKPATPTFALPAGGGQRVLVPFAAADLGRHGFVVLENAHTTPSIDPSDTEWLEALGAQLGVLLGNITLWQQLALARERLELENRYFRESAPTAAAGSQMVAHSPAMGEVMELIARVAPSKATVLITGETGVGKELVAHEVHRQSPRRDRPFIAVHIASLAPGLVASGLFGHERGAFTGATERARGRFELADGGTLLLDEVGELSLDDQVKLLRVLQEGIFERVGGSRPLRSDFRLVASTNRDLEAEVRAGRFREDLYYRLCAFPIPVPPLRERREEIPTLALLFMERVARQRGVHFEGIGTADMERLQAWDWPGNVRELEHVIERASLLSEPPRLRIPPLEGGLRREQLAPVTEESWVTLAEVERRYVLQVLEHTGGRVSGPGGGAEILGFKPSTLNFRVRKLGLVEALAGIRSRDRSKLTTGD